MEHIAIGGDHAGLEYKQYISEQLIALNYKVKDFGPFDSNSVDYPDHTHPLATSVGTGENRFGIFRNCTAKTWRKNELIG